jgi:hypothetical protein
MQATIIRIMEKAPTNLGQFFHVSYNLARSAPHSLYPGSFHVLTPATLIQALSFRRGKMLTLLLILFFFRQLVDAQITGDFPSCAVRLNRLLELSTQSELTPGRNSGLPSISED